MPDRQGEFLTCDRLAVAQKNKTCYAGKDYPHMFDIGGGSRTLEQTKEKLR